MRKHLAILLTALAFIGCANRGIGPQGGPRDSIPPSILKATPENGALEFNGKELELAFNEYIQLDNITQNLLMSPPQQHQPEVKARGKRVLVQFKDSLRDSTTYTLDFGNAICDYTEKNPLRGYLFSFSTGPYIDTLEMTGRIFDAQTLNPMSGVIVGIHSNHNDSAFTSFPFDRICRSDSAGAFRIANMKQGSYRLYAVNEISRDYMLTAGESLAFYDQLVAPGDTAVLWLFSSLQQRLYMGRTTRDKQHKIQLTFSAQPDSLPVVKPLIDTLAILTTFSSHADTVTIWLTDSSSISIDSLYFEVRYRRTDSLYHLEWTTDTIRAMWRTPRLSAKALQLKLKRDAERKMELKSNASSKFEINDTLRITSATPIKSIIADSIHLFEKIDTILKPVSFRLAPRDSLSLTAKLIAPLKAGKSYVLNLDSAAMHDIYDIPSRTTKYSLQLKTPEDYSTLRVKLNPFLPKARIQLLNIKDEVVREMPADTKGAFFQYLKPDNYYLRLYIDENGDGKWTTGSWDEKSQPEQVYYFPAKLQTKPNWDFEEEWDYLALPQTQAKPAELIKASSAKKR